MALGPLLVILLGACDPPGSTQHDSCVPQCTGECAVPDGCGGTCCDDQVQNAAGDWVAPEDCHDTCQSAGAACGSFCGQSCGQCEDGQVCSGGSCVCRRVCDGSRCDDGCGGHCPCDAGDVCGSDGRCVPVEDCPDTCDSLGASCGEVCGELCGTCANGKVCSLAACVESTNCTDCELMLKVVEGSKLKRARDQVVLAIDFAPPDGAPLPRMAEFRLQVEGPATLIEAQPGDALSKAGKALYRDPFTGQAFKRARDGAYRLLAYGASSASEIGAGRIAELCLRATGTEPVRVFLQRREQTFAPAGADALLQTSSYDAPLLVKP